MSVVLADGLVEDLVVQLRNHAFFKHLLIDFLSVFVLGIESSPGGEFRSHSVQQVTTRVHTYTTLLKHSRLVQFKCLPGRVIEQGMLVEDLRATLILNGASVSCTPGPLAKGSSLRR